MTKLAEAQGSVTVSIDPPSPAGDDVSAGTFAASCLQRQARRIVSLQSTVLADADPEPLHQMRVRCRQLRSTLDQFGPAMQLPDAVAEERLRRLGRRLGVVRDLDVLQARLKEQVMPSLGPKGHAAVRKLIKRIRRERALAFEDLDDALRGRRYLKWLADLQAWLRAPRFTSLGEQPLRLWLPEYRQAVLSGLMLLPGWQVDHPHHLAGLESLHQLRLQIKRARYGLINLKPLDTQGLAPWIDRFASLQAQLGSLQDLELLEKALLRILDAPLEQSLPAVWEQLLKERERTWIQWLNLSAPLRTPAGRAELHRLMLSTQATA